MNILSIFFVQVFLTCFCDFYIILLLFKSSDFRPENCGTYFFQQLGRISKTKRSIQNFLGVTHIIIRYRRLYHEAIFHLKAFSENEPIHASLVYFISFHSFIIRQGSPAFEQQRVREGTYNKCTNGHQQQL